MLNLFFAILNGALEQSKSALPKVWSFLALALSDSSLPASDVTLCIRLAFWRQNDRVVASVYWLLVHVRNVRVSPHS